MVWFRDYKLPDGKPASAFGYGGAPLGAAMASRVISDTHALYQAQAPGAHVRCNKRPLLLWWRWAVCMRVLAAWPQCLQCTRPPW